MGALGGIQTVAGARIEVVLSYDSSAALVNAVNAATADERGETPFVIRSNEHRAWWKPNERGYTSSLELAGCYSRSRAMEICYTAGPTSLRLPRSRDNGFVPAEIMMRLDDARRSTMWFRNNAQVQP